MGFDLPGVKSKTTLETHLQIAVQDETNRFGANLKSDNLTLKIKALN